MFKCKYMNRYFSSFQKSRGGRSPPEKFEGDTSPPSPPPPGSPPMHYWTIPLSQNDVKFWRLVMRRIRVPDRSIVTSRKRDANTSSNQVMLKFSLIWGQIRVFTNLTRIINSKHGLNWLCYRSEHDLVKLSTKMTSVYACLVTRRPERINH